MNEQLKEVLLDVILHIRIAAQIHHEAGEELDKAANVLKSFYLKLDSEVGDGSKKEEETNS